MNPRPNPHWDKLAAALRKAGAGERPAGEDLSAPHGFATRIVARARADGRADATGLTVWRRWAIGGACGALAVLGAASLVPPPEPVPGNRQRNDALASAARAEGRRQAAAIRGEGRTRGAQVSNQALADSRDVRAQGEAEVAGLNARRDNLIEGLGTRRQQAVDLMLARRDAGIATLSTQRSALHEEITLADSLAQERLEIAFSAAELALDGLETDAITAIENATTEAEGEIDRQLQEGYALLDDLENHSLEELNALIGGVCDDHRGRRG